MRPDLGGFESAIHKLCKISLAAGGVPLEFEGGINEEGLNDKANKAVEIAKQYGTEIEFKIHEE